MSDYYVDLALTGTGHVGTSGDPFSVDDVFDTTGNVANIVSGNDNDTYFFKGRALLPSSYTVTGYTSGQLPIGIGTRSMTFAPWDASTFGPWRLGIDGTMQIGGATEVRGGIFSALSLNTGANGISTSIVNPLYANDCFFVSRDGSGPIFFGNRAGGSISRYKGCSFKSNALYQWNGDSRDEFTDSIFVLKTFFQLGSSQPCLVTDCASTVGIGGSGTTVTDCQTDWTPASFPSFDSSQTAFTDSIVSATISLPPEPGNYPYSGYATGLWGEARSGIGALYFDPNISAPVIVGQPASLSKVVGADVSFSVYATGTLPFSYQWFKDNTAIPSATSLTYSIASVSLANVGSYKARVTNDYGTVDSSVATLAVEVTPPALGISWAERQPTLGSDTRWCSGATDATGTNLIAGETAGRLYVSHNSGVAWTETQPAGDVGKTWIATASSSDGTYLVAAALGGRLYTSANSGSSWTERQPAGNIDPYWQRVSSSWDGAKLIVCCGGGAGLPGRLYTSTNFGATWAEQQPMGNVDEFWECVAISGDGSFMIAAVNMGRLFVSTNGGSSWVEKQPAGAVNKQWQWVSTDHDGSTIIAAVYNGWIYVSTNSGKKWSECRPAGNVMKGWTATSVNEDGSQIIICATDGRIYTSSDLGSSWTERQPAGNNNESWRLVAVNPLGNFFIAGADNGRFYTGTMVAAPVVTNQPDDVHAESGTRATFTVGATGALHYQWMRDGIGILGATDATYVMPSVYKSLEGQYSVYISNEYSGVNSDSAKLHVTKQNNPRGWIDMASTGSISSTGRLYSTTYTWVMDGTSNVPFGVQQQIDI